eukprot:TRINITY_DN24435_c0_g2_i1.p1 TRINITY_DN24435_c0_g2~~TRINITY_DN24435_c0_g2_i1.p1  ORF type:complete len:425 (-),score=15.17 TRINITY_DN24435_c0_g2_i1:225-1499(-)
MMGVDDASETDALLQPIEKEASFLSIIGIGSVYTVSVIPVVLPALLSPALEADAGLSWTLADTARFIGSNQVGEALGMIALGWIADYIGGATAFSIGLALLAVLQVGISFVSSPLSLLSLYVAMIFIRGVVFGSAVKLVANTLGETQWGVGVCIIGVASRSGDLLMAELFGLLEPTYGWRGVMRFYACFTCIGVMWFAVVNHYSSQRRYDHAALSVPVALKSLWSDPDYWSVFALITFVQPLWVWGSFVPTYAHSIYHESIAKSAFAYRATKTGEVCALLIAMGVLLYSGINSRRIFHACVVVIAAVSALLPVMMMYYEMDETAFLILASVIGGCAALIDYVPPALYFMFRGKSSGTSSLYISFSYGVVYPLGGLTAWVFGNLRSRSEMFAFKAETWCAVVCLILCSSTLMLHMVRSWNTVLAC